MVWRLVAAGVLAALLAGCGGDDAVALRLDGSPRVPDDEGVATSLDAESLTLDGERRYDISPDLMAFSTYTLEAEPLVRRRGQYVQVGLDGDTVEWMAGVAAVVPAGSGSLVYYTGRFRGRHEGRWSFADGTTFAVARGVVAPEPGAQVQVVIDPDRHAIVAVAG